MGIFALPPSILQPDFARSRQEIEDVLTGLTGSSRCLMDNHFSFAKLDYSVPWVCMESAILVSPYLRNSPIDCTF